MYTIFIPIERRDDEKQEVYGYAQTEEKATDGLILTNEAMRKAIDSYFKEGPALRSMHQIATGIVKSAEVNEKGTFISARVVDPMEWLKVKEGVYRGFSVAGRITSMDGEKITGFDWIETSLVDRPADPGAKITLWRCEDVNIQRRATPFADLPIDEDLERPWDASAAEARVRKWAGGDKENMDWAKYRKAFFWYDPENAENFYAYKLPFADVINGELRAVWRGVRAAMAALLGARGGVDIPASERRDVYDHIVRYYKKFDKEPPEFRLLSEDEVLGKGGLTVERKKKVEEEKKELEEIKEEVVVSGESGDVPQEGQSIVHEVIQRLERIEKLLVPESNSDELAELVKRLEKLEEENKALKERIEKLEETPVPPKVKASFAVERKIADMKERNKPEALSIAKRLKELERERKTNLSSYEREGRSQEALELLAQLRELGYGTEILEEV